MSQRKWVWEGLIAAGVLILAVVLNVATVEESLNEQSARAQRRLQKAISTIIEHAHHAKDDLAVQETVHGLGEAPGILFAGVVGKDGLYLAHSQPTLLGKAFHRSRMPLAAFPLGEASARWGTLLFAWSDPSLHQSLVRQAGFNALGAIMLWMAWMSRSQMWRRYVAQLDADILDNSKILVERQTALERLERDFSETQNVWAGRFQASVNKIPHGVIFLDQNQRIAAISAQAMRLLGLTASPVGKSWLDTAVLQASGVALEKSLAQPGRVMECSPDHRPLRLQFDTPANNSNGTWVTIIESNEVVK